MSVDWDGIDDFFKVDYKELETRALAHMQQSGKSLNFGQTYGMGLGEFDSDRVCEKCGYLLYWGPYAHGKRECTYLQAMGRQADQGHVPVPPLYLKILKTAGIAFTADLLRTKGVLDSKQEDGPYQRGLYAPVWAVLALQQSKVGNLTSLKRPKVQAAILVLQRLQGDVADQKMLAGEHLLAKGSYTRACRALVAKASE